MTAEAIPPGGETEIETTLKTKGRAGALKKTITVYSNDPETPQLVLTLSGQLWVDVEARPARLHFGTLQPGQEATRPLELKITEPDRVKISKVSVEDERFTIQPKGDGSQSYEVAFSGSKKIGQIQARLVVDYTTPKGKDHLDVAIFCQVIGDLRYPRSVYFRKVGGTYESENLVVSSRSNEPVRILSGKDPKGRVAVKVLEVNGSRAQVELTVVEGQGDSSRGEIELKTTDAREPIVTIPYNLQVAYRRPAGIKARQRLETK